MSVAGTKQTKIRGNPGSHGGPGNHISTWLVEVLANPRDPVFSSHAGGFLDARPGIGNREIQISGRNPNLRKLPKSPSPGVNSTWLGLSDPQILDLFGNPKSPCALISSPTWAFGIQGWGPRLQLPNSARTSSLRASGVSVRAHVLFILSRQEALLLEAVALLDSSVEARIRARIESGSRRDPRFNARGDLRSSGSQIHPPRTPS